MPISPNLLLPLLAILSIQSCLAQNSSATSLTTRTQLVVVDVVVTDNKQNPVHNLTASDFTALEDNAAQRIKSFEEHTTANAAKSEPPLVLPPGNFASVKDLPPVALPPATEPLARRQ
jgi:hypothetical protein